MRDEPTLPLVTLPRHGEVVDIHTRSAAAPAPPAEVLRLTQVIPLPRRADETPDPGPDAA